MIVWQGAGCLVIIIPGLISLLVSFMSFIPEALQIVISLIIGGILLFLIGKNLHNPKTNEITLYDENMLPHTIKRNIDTLYWIPIEIWGIILIILGICYFLCYLISLIFPPYSSL